MYRAASRGGSAAAAVCHCIVVEAAALMHDAQLRVADEQVDHAAGNRAVQPPRALGPAGDEDRAQAVTERPRA